VSRLDAFFGARSWSPFAFQRETWRAYRDGESGLVHVPTGMGKTLAAIGGVLEEALERPGAERSGSNTTGLRVVWLTPLRALARDTVESLTEVVDELGLGWRVELRSGDSTSAQKARQRRSPPEILVTTPESLSLLLSYPDHPDMLTPLSLVVVDEWHELLASKRGTQTELAVSRLRRLNPGLRIWGLSATLANLHEALACLLGASDTGRLIDAGDEAPAAHIEIETLIPTEVVRFPWAGHIGLALLNQVVSALDAPGTALLFTNTRAQAEIWYRAVVDARPDWTDEIALHHGSLDRGLRDEVEERLRRGDVRCVVCTSTLDLGVDFSPVDRVLQVGSPKGIARLMQRAGRSGHHPGGVRRVIGVPTHALEVVEFAAAREATAQGLLEARAPLQAPLDVLTQHMVTLALGGGFSADELFDEVRTTWAYRELDRARFDWALDFITRGGSALQAYPRYHRVLLRDGRYVVTDRGIALRHRQSIGTITDDGQVLVRFARGQKLGHIEEGFISRLTPGDRFFFAGRELELVRVRNMEAWVRRPRTRAPRRAVPRWMGGRLPLSTQLAGQVAKLLGSDDTLSREMRSMRPLLEAQQRGSALPAEGSVLCERHRSREGYHVFMFPFLGRLAHEGLATLLGHRLTAISPRTVQMSFNDYGLELVSPDTFPDDEATWRGLLASDGLVDDLLRCLNTTELARRRFREIARVSGLVFQGRPGRSKSARQLQASAGLVFDVLERWDPDNELVAQARQEVLRDELEFDRIAQALHAMSSLQMHWTAPARLTPLAFPIWADRISTSVSSESWLDRVRRAAAELEAAAGGV